MSDENKELLKHFLNRTFFRDWKDKTDEREKLFDNLEFQISSKCDLGCLYCYYNDTKGFGKELNPSSKPDDIRENARALLDYLGKNGLYPGGFEIFSGEPTIHPVTFDVLDMVIDFYSSAGQKSSISMPTNMSFLRSDHRTKRVIAAKWKANRNGIGFGISASVDGKYMDHCNRPPAAAIDDYYSDGFYDSLFRFAKEYGCGFHPMVYHNNIEQWKDNFDWFQENFEKYDLPWNNIYLLEVRNDGWTKESVNAYKDFYKHVLGFAYNKMGRDAAEFVYGFIFNGCGVTKSRNNMNLFNNIGRIGRGVGCSLQTTMMIRGSDLTVNPCHRQSYDALNSFSFVKNAGEITDIKPLNVPYYLSIMSTDRAAWPYCESCLIKKICMSGCLGAQFEVMGDPFIPIPSVCLLEFGKVTAQIEFMQEIGVFELFLDQLPETQKKAFVLFSKLLR